MDQNETFLGTVRNDRWIHKSMNWSKHRKGNVIDFEVFHIRPGFCNLLSHDIAGSFVPLFVEKFMSSKHV